MASVFNIGDFYSNVFNTYAMNVHDDLTWCTSIAMMIHDGITVL